jgi:hypothetical protein
MKCKYTHNGVEYGSKEELLKSLNYSDSLVNAIKVYDDEVGSDDMAAIKDYLTNEAPTEGKNNYDAKVDEVKVAHPDLSDDDADLVVSIAESHDVSVDEAKDMVVNNKPSEGEEVKLPPLINGGMERVMVFQGGEWVQKVGGITTQVGQNVKEQAQEAFMAENQSATTTEGKPAKVEAAQTQEGVGEQMDESPVFNEKNGTNEAVTIFADVDEALAAKGQETVEKRAAVKEKHGDKTYKRAVKITREFDKIITRLEQEGKITKECP